MAGVTLHLNEAGWREHLRSVSAAVPGLVPVIKGNGYGFGLARLAAEADRLGVESIAVGLPAEVPQVRDAFRGSIVVLSPYDPTDPLARELTGDPRVISTVSRVGDLDALSAERPTARVLIEVLTSMRRHGIDPFELREAAVGRLGSLQFGGWTIHLPLRVEGRRSEALRLALTAVTARRATPWFSHLDPADLPSIDAELPGTPARLRMGTKLWLGAPTSRRTTATVLDVHPIRRGQRAGYRQRPSPGDGWIVVLAGGTSHGVGMEAPTPATTLRQRAISLASGSLEAAGRALSPYTIDGRKRWFLEPPHMQTSLVFLPAKAQPPAVADEVPVELRLTTATVDRVAAS